MGDTTESDYSVDTNHNQNSSFYEPMGPPQPNELTFAPSGPSRSDNNSTFHGLYHHANKTFAPLKNVTINESTDPTFGGTMDFYPSNPNSTFLGQTLATSLGLDQEFFGQPESASIREGNIFRILLWNYFMVPIKILDSAVSDSRRKSPIFFDCIAAISPHIFSLTWLDINFFP